MDAGIDSPTALVAGNITKGIIEAHRTELYLKDKKPASGGPVVKAALVAGPSFFVITEAVFKKPLHHLSNNSLILVTD